MVEYVTRRLRAHSAASAQERGDALALLKVAMWAPSGPLTVASPTRFQALRVLKPLLTPQEFIGLYADAPADVSPHDKYELSHSLMAAGVTAARPEPVVQARELLRSLDSTLPASQLHRLVSLWWSPVVDTGCLAAVTFPSCSATRRIA